MKYPISWSKVINATSVFKGNLGYLIKQPRRKLNKLSKEENFKYKIN